MMTTTTTTEEKTFVEKLMPSGKRSGKAIVAFDIETTGPDARSSVIAIGVCVGTPNGNVLMKQRWSIEPMPGDRIDSACWSEFWINPDMPNNLTIWEEIRSAWKSAHLAVEDFIVFLLTLDHAFEEVTIASDNPAFDIGRIDTLIHRVAPSFGALRYLGSKFYRSIADPDQMLEGAFIACPQLKAKYDNWCALIAAKVTHDHRPENDAEKIYYGYVFVTTEMAPTAPHTVMQVNAIKSSKLFLFLGLLGSAERHFISRLLERNLAVVAGKDPLMKVALHEHADVAALAHGIPHGLGPERGADVRGRQGRHVVVGPECGRDAAPAEEYRLTAHRPVARDTDHLLIAVAGGARLGHDHTNALDACHGPCARCGCCRRCVHDAQLKILAVLLVRLLHCFGRLVHGVDSQEGSEDCVIGGPNRTVVLYAQGHGGDVGQDRGRRRQWRGRLQGVHTHVATPIGRPASRDAHEQGLAGPSYGTTGARRGAGRGLAAPVARGAQWMRHRGLHEAIGRTGRRVGRCS